MEDDNGPASLYGGGKLWPRSNNSGANVDVLDGSVPSYGDDGLVHKYPLQELELPASLSPDILPPGEVYVPFKPGSENNNGSYYSCLRCMLENDQILPTPVYDPTTQKQVLQSIRKPRIGTVQYVLDTRLQESSERSKGEQQMQFFSKEIDDVDRHRLYFASKADLMCHISQYQATQQSLLSVSQPVFCSSTSVSLSVGRLGQHFGPQTGLGQGNGIFPQCFGWFLLASLFLLWQSWFTTLLVGFPQLLTSTTHCLYKQGMVGWCLAVWSPSNVG
jgi:hypothetical protein